MQNFEIVKFFESSKRMNDDTPDKIFIKVLSFLLMLGNLVVQITIIRELHYNAKFHRMYHRLLPSRKASL